MVLTFDFDVSIHLSNFREHYLKGCKTSKRRNNNQNFDDNIGYMKIYIKFDYNIIIERLINKQ